MLARSGPSKRGRIARSSRCVGPECDGRCGVRRLLLPDEIAAAYGKVVWSWRRDRGVYFAGGIPQTTVTKNAAHRGEHEGNRKTIARGKPVRLAELVVDLLVGSLFLLPPGCGCIRRPAFPAP